MTYQVRVMTVLGKDTGSILASMSGHSQPSVCSSSFRDCNTLLLTSVGTAYTVHIHANKTVRHIKMMLMSEGSTVSYRITHQL